MGKLNREQKELILSWIGIIIANFFLWAVLVWAVITLVRHFV